MCRVTHSSVNKVEVGTEETSKENGNRICYPKIQS